MASYLSQRVTDRLWTDEFITWSLNIFPFYFKDRQRIFLFYSLSTKVTMRQCFGCSELISIRTSPAPLDLISVPLGTGGYVNVNWGITEPFQESQRWRQTWRRSWRKGTVMSLLTRITLRSELFLVFVCKQRKHIDFPFQGLETPDNDFSIHSNSLCWNPSTNPLYSQRAKYVVLHSFRPVALFTWDPWTNWL